VNSGLYEALVKIFFGAIAGGITNSVAVWMLFHPYEPPRIFGRPIRLLQGAIPKNKARLARAMGRTVGNTLLTPEDLARTVSEPGFRAAFDERLSAFLADVLHQERGSLAELLPESTLADVRDLLNGAISGLAVRFGQYIDSDEFAGHGLAWVARIANEIEDRPIGEILTPAREAAITDIATRWIEDTIESEKFANAVRDYLDRGAVHLLAGNRTFQDVLPLGLVAAVERSIAGYLPIALERLSGVLDDVEARRKLQRVLREIFDRFMADLKFHQRLVAALLITPETVDKVLRAIEDEGANKIAEMLQDPSIRDAMARSVNHAIVDFLEKPVSSIVGQPGDPSVESAKAAITEWVTGLARDPNTRNFLGARLSAAIGSAGERTWGDIFRHIPPERFADALVAMARSSRARELYTEAGNRIVEKLVHARIGRISDHLAPDAPARIERAIADPLWQWIQEQVPPIAQQVRIAERVEEKILNFPTEKVEQIVKGVTERELKLIVQLGYVLGAIIGGLSALF